MSLLPKLHLLIVSNFNTTKASGKHYLNSAVVLVFKVKLIHAKCIIKIDVYSFQRMVDMPLFYGHANGNIMEAKCLYQQHFLQW
jgi:hypothetical protein